jgi:hypothetical protein
VVDGEPGAAVGSGVGRVTPENVAGCGEQTTVFVGYAWASTRAPVHKPARKSRSPPRASMHVEALVMTALQDDLADWTGKRRGSRTSLTVAANAKKRRTGSVDGRPRLQYAVRKPGDGKEEGPSMLNECNCGPAHLRQSASLHSDARCAGRVEEFL